MYLKLLTCTYFLCILQITLAQTKQEKYDLQNSSGITVDGPHRFVTIAGITGIHVKSLKTKAFVSDKLLLLRSRGPFLYGCRHLKTLINHTI
jgi:hypothetical protein